MRWSERRAAKRSQLLVADNPEIARYLAKYNKPTQTIAYGSQVVEAPENAVQILQEAGLPTHNFHVHIGRVQPDNHIWEILAAAEESGERVVAIGDYSTRYGRKLRKIFDAKHLYFPGTIYDKTVLNALRTQAVFYLHGHSVGGTNPALLEAMGCGAMVLAHNNPFNASVLGGLGALWSDEDELKELLKQRPSAEVRAEQAEISKARVKDYFNWSQIANQYLEAMAGLQ